MTLLLASVLLPGCRGSRPTDDVSPPQPTLLEPAIPAGYKKLAPAPADTSAQMIAQTSTIFRGTLKDIKFTYDECAGPRTNYVFSDASPLEGATLAAEVNLSILGGPTPSGTWVTVSELPKLALASEYVIFLRNTDWTFSPIVGNLVFRRETIGGRELLVDPTGHAVTGWGENGPELSAASVSETVGRHVRGYRGIEARETTANGASGDTNPAPVVEPSHGNPPPPAPAPTVASALSRAPSAEEIGRAGLFARPAVSAEAIGDQQTATVESLLSLVRAAAERDHVKVGGKLTLVPYWRCWSVTPTAKTGQ